MDNSLRMQNIKNKEGESIKGTRKGLRRRERTNSATMMELWAEKERNEEEEEEKRMRQKEKKCDEIFKRSKLVERLPSKRIERENEAGDGTKELIIVLKDLKKEKKAWAEAERYVSITT